ncbi:cytochrome c biogenesis CcdA family protein [Dethiobacter alkaliphilus]|uniref:cytochrome c biogenesis CcdA family protein n=1 Tax=Dethiobacter alkaliphilus TaxID=427926 RepID=UPI002227F5A5|nr:cytochrome c biogenesis protein CcdA [Dethiobacter alkaliphilus]MCW3491266.1 hypothetical protein [Dethiobacter alkaliphilus]
MEQLFHNLLDAITSSAGIHPLFVLLPLAAGFIAFFNPCMLGIVPILAHRAQHWQQAKKIALLGHISVFSGGFLLSLAGWTVAFTAFLRLAGLWAGLWPKALGVVYLGLALYLLGLRVPRKLLPQAVGFYQRPKPLHPYVATAFLGVLFGAVPSPCTTPLVMGVTTMVVPNLGFSTGLLVVLLYGLGHTIPLVLMALLSNRFKITTRLRHVHGVFRTAMALLLFALAIYFFLYQAPMLPVDIHEPTLH